MVRDHVIHPDKIMIAHLRALLEASRKNEESLTEEIKQFQERISAVAIVEKRLSTEKTLREQKEYELRRFRNTESVNKKLTAEVQALQQEVAVLKGKSTSVSKRLEEQKQLLKDKEAEREKMMEQYGILRKQFEYYRKQTNDLIPYREEALKAKQKSAELRKEIQNQAKQIQIQLNNVGCFERQVKNLKSDKKELKWSQTQMSSQMDRMRKDVVALKSEIETHKDEAFKQGNFISKLQSDASVGRKVKRKLEKNADETMQHVKDQDQKISDLKAEIRNYKDEQTEMKLKMTVLKNERDANLENLLKAQREIGVLNTTIEKQQQEIHVRTLHQNKVDTELNQIEKDYDSTRNRLIEVTNKLEQTQVLQDRYKDGVKQNQKLEDEKYRMILTEKEGLKRELQHSVNQASQQRHTINVQKTANETLEQTVKSLRQKVESLMLQNKDVGAENDRVKVSFAKLLAKRLVFVTASKKRVHDTRHALYKYRQHSEQERHAQRQAALVEAQREKIEELKLALARRPDDTIQKLVKCQWDNRELKKQLMAFQGEKIMYESCYRRVKEENRKLSDALSDVKVEAWQKRKAAESRRESQQPSRQTPFPVSAARTPSQAEGGSSVSALRPLTTTTQLCVGKFMPHPPPSLNPKRTSEPRLPEIEVRRLLPSRATVR